MKPILIISKEASLIELVGSASRKLKSKGKVAESLEMQERAWSSEDPTLAKNIIKEYVILKEKNLKLFS